MTSGRTRSTVSMISTVLPSSATSTILRDDTSFSLRSSVCSGGRPLFLLTVRSRATTTTSRSPRALALSSVYMWPGCMMSKTPPVRTTLIADLPASVST
ncbi:MAG: hypothetical protein RXR47_00860 [Nitrososphaeria archaeon]